ncbi:MAG: putative selenium-dependent hydroxylase accessory protein YqeC [Syntrophaceae bacterium]|nr:putative selenium-dependent hydroxylase accessory protein YqeC [Syntrophaceae bacterium]
MTLADAFQLKDPEIISLVGGGGKTTLMFSWGREMAERQRGVILTTTTKIWEPQPSADFLSFVSRDFSTLREWILGHLPSSPCLLVARARLENGKLDGIPPAWIEEIEKIPGVTCILAEADGAKGYSLKAPREGEPVVPLNTTLLVPVVGIDALGCTLDENHVFRWRGAMEILQKPEGTILDEEMIARLLAATLEKCPEKARGIPYINKIDSPYELERGRKLGQALLNLPGQEIKRVILGQAQKVPVVKEVISRPLSA